MRRWLGRYRWALVGALLGGLGACVCAFMALVALPYALPLVRPWAQRESVVAACTITLLREHQRVASLFPVPRWLVGPAAWCSPSPLLEQVRLGMWIVGALVLLRLLTIKPLWALWRLVWWWVQGVGRLQPGTTHGTAAWAGWRAVRRQHLRRREPPYALGRARGRLVGLRASGQSLNVLIVGQPGVGKSSALFVANLLRAARWWWPGQVRPSRVITDPKGEFYALTSQGMNRTHRVARIDFFDVTAARYNPLAQIQGAADAQRFARLLLENTGGMASDNPFWDATVVQMLVAAIMHLNHLARQQGRDGATLAELRDFVSRADFRAMAEEMKRSVPEARRAALTFMANVQKKPELEGSIQAGIPLRFQFLNEEMMATTTAASDIPFASLGRKEGKPWCVYVTITRNREEVIQPLVVAFFTQLYDALVQEAERSPRGRLERTVIMDLDEAGTIGKLGDLDRWLNTARAVGVWFRLAVQTFGQLVDTYGEVHANTIAEGCQTFVFFGGAKVSPHSATWMSEQLGQATRISQARNASRDREEVLVGHGGLSRSEVGSALMSPDDILRMPRHQAIIVPRHARPFRVKTKSWESYRWMRRMVGQTGEVGALGRPRVQPDPLVESAPRRWAVPGEPLRERRVHDVDWSFDL